MGWIMRVELTTSRATIWRSNQLSYTHHIFGRGGGTRTPGPMVLDARAMAILQRENQGSEKGGSISEGMQRPGGSRPEDPTHSVISHFSSFRRPKPGLSSVQDAPGTGDTALFLVPRPPRGHRMTGQDPRAGAAPTQGSWLKGALCWFFF